MVRAAADDRLQILWDDGERVFCRERRASGAGCDNVLLARLAAEHPPTASLDRITYEFGLRHELDSAWAVLPLELVRERGRTVLLFEDPGGEPLARLLGAPMETGLFLRLAVPIVAALGKLHQSGLVHKDLKPAHILVNCADGLARLTGFGLASRLPRERQAPEPPETLTGTLAYMAPEQTGRMNRSIDSRSDLYALGVTLYQMLTGVLPFTATDPMEWVHCHIARRPVPPSARVQTVPAVISDIVTKLLAKTAEERYQTAAGVERDLRQCLTGWQRCHVKAFPLGEDDAPGRLLIPEKLYGREREVDTLIAAFDRIVECGVPELVLVSGYSGIGKSSVVNELHKVLVPPRGLFASGKFDQYKRDIPYATLVQAFQGLVRMLLGKSDTELAGWRAALLEALSPNVALLSDLIPELKLIVGEPPLVPELEPQQAKQRFLHVFRRFIGVFAQADHPLALFLDDLQWLDAATLDLLADLLTHPDLRYLMLIGAYRDNEVDAAHPLTARLQAVSNAGAKVEEIRLASLTRAHIAHLIADALRCAPESIEPLARLVRDRTGGNPFFVIQFLQALAEGNLLTFDHDVRQWRWDTEGIHAKGYTDNVADLMAGKLTRLPAATQHALQQLACLGNVAGIATLSAVLGMQGARVHAALWEAVRQELAVRAEDAYAFVHDRIHEAAYSLIPQASRADAHLRIGRLLVAHTPEEKREEAIFEIVGQLNRGAVLITERDERDHLAELNLLAGQRAKASSAYASALAYFATGVGLLSDDCWQRQHDLLFTLELNRAECEFLTGQLPAAEARLSRLSKCAATTPERAQVACRQMDVHIVSDQCDQAITVGLAFLRRVGIAWSPHPDEMAVQSEYERIGSLLGDRTIEGLIDLPPMQDAVAIATVEVLTKLFAAALVIDGQFAGLAICKAVSLSLEHGNGDASCVAYAYLPRIAGRLFGDYEAGFRFSQLGCQLVERRGLERYAARTYHARALYVTRWLQPARTCRDQFRHILDALSRTGDLTYGVFARNHLTSTLLFIGESLADVQREAESGLAYARKVRFGLVIHCIEVQLALIRTLRGLTPVFGCLEVGQCNEAHSEHLLSKPSLSTAACWYWVRKLQARYLAGKYEAATAAASKAQALLWTSYSFNEDAEYYLYAALARSARCDSLPAGDLPQHLDALTAHHNQLRVWAELCPENFASHSALVGAEIARIEGRVVDAEMLYERAIRSAQESGFAQVEALASELASRFYAARGLGSIARMYMQNACYGYVRWGANAKVRQLEEQCPYLRTQEMAPVPTNTMAAPIEHIELATVIKVVQAVSGEIHLEKLIEMIMRTAIEQAGAERGLLILSDGEPRIEAEAISGSGRIEVSTRRAAIGTFDLPQTVLQYVIRTQEHVLIDDASADIVYSRDEYVRRNHSRSVLCLPILKHAKLGGALYLENDLTSGVFTSNRVALLQLLASQAAISLENAALYTDLQRSEAFLSQGQRISHTGSFGWCVASGEYYWSEEGYNMLEYDKGVQASAELALQRIHPADRESVRRLLEEAISEKKDFDSEHRFVMPDGRIKHVHATGRAVNTGKLDFVGAIRDVTENKRAEEALREALIDLTRVNRVTTMGELTVSLAHEINQPITAAITYANACLRWLDRDKPDLDEARAAATRMVKDGERAAQIMSRIRAQFEKGTLSREVFDVSETIRETVDLLRGEAVRYNISVRIGLAANLPRIVGDRVQLQQVALNLIVNGIEAMKDVNGIREMVVGSRWTEDGQILVSVSDTGIGVPSHFADQIFDPFFTTKPHGTGMGLRISRSIVESHGGQLWVAGAPGRGAIFQFTLPATIAGGN
nr:ATP-binding sensor histidine kinase [Burkholderia sp. 9120]